MIFQTEMSAVYSCINVITSARTQTVPTHAHANQGTPYRLMDDRVEVGGPNET